MTFNPIGILASKAMGSTLQKLVRKHFGDATPRDIMTAGRTFPPICRVDVQGAVEDLLRERATAKLIGIQLPQSHMTLSGAELLTPGPFRAEIGPLQFDDIDIGDTMPMRCLRAGVWLGKQAENVFALLLAPAMQHGVGAGTRVEILVRTGDQGVSFSQDFLRELELRVMAARTYRGRVLSFDGQAAFSGQGGSIKVHRLKQVRRDEIILPEKTLRLLDRNIGQFVTAREQIKKLRFSGKKGLLFHGAPGTGKTHTIHYLASQLPGHTTLLVTAEQVMFFGEYFRLARHMQPAMMVIEDVDLIARERGRAAGHELLLNKLLNEMDGLREDADVIFVLTTNRPDQLEQALAARPGRIDQAIEFPLPDDEGRAKLVKLYGGDLEISDELLELVVRRTQGASAAFIKELMRRSAQFQIEAGRGRTLQQPAVDSAIEEMVFQGGALNLQLLGGSAMSSDREIR